MPRKEAWYLKLGWIRGSWGGFGGWTAYYKKLPSRLYKKPEKNVPFYHVAPPFYNYIITKNQDWFRIHKILVMNWDRKPIGVGSTVMGAYPTLKLAIGYADVLIRKNGKPYPDKEM
jgi:hypothetical protein